MVRLVTGGPTTDPSLARADRSGSTGESSSSCGLPGDGGLGRAPRGARPPPCLARGRSGQRFKLASSRSSDGRPSGEPVAKGWEARGAAERGHGQDAPTLVPRGAGTELAAGARSAHEARRELGRRPTVIRGVRSILRVDGSWVLEPRCRCSDRGQLPRRLSARRRTRSRVRPCHVWRRERPDPEPWWSKLWRVRIPGEHRRAALPWPGSRSSQNGLPRGAKLRSGRAGR